MAESNRHRSDEDAPDSDRPDHRDSADPVGDAAIPLADPSEEAAPPPKTGDHRTTDQAAVGLGRGRADENDREDSDADDNDDADGIFDLADDYEQGDPATRRRSAIKALDICPNCSEPIEDIRQTVCMKCGFNLRTLEVIKTKAEVQEIDEETIRGREPISPPGRGGVTVPLIAASVSIVILLAAYIAGHFGLFAATVNEARHASTGALPADYVVPWLTRFRGILQYMVLLATWFGIGIGTLWLYARVMEHPMGELRLAAARILAIVACMKLASLLPITTAGVRGPLEILGHLAILYALSVALFRITIRSGWFFVVIATVMTMIVYLASSLIVWSVS